MKTTGVGREAAVSPLGWSSGLTVEVGATGTVAHAGVVLPRLLADRSGLTMGLSGVLARSGFTPVRHRGRVLVDVAAALATGATCMTDVEALTRSEELFGPGGGASDSTVLRGLGEFGAHLDGHGLPRRRLARLLAGVTARMWRAAVGRHGGLPPVLVAGRPLVRADGTAVTVLRLDGTIVDSASWKQGVTPHYRHGIGFHPLTAWGSNLGDNLGVMLRPGNAGSFTAADHVRLVDHALARIPAEHRRDVLVTVDGAGASHALVEHLTALNTFPVQGRRGRRLEYSVGWPVDSRTRRGIGMLAASDWTPALAATGEADPDAQIAEITGLLRGTRQLDGWPADMRVIVRRTPREPGEQAALTDDPDFRYEAFATSTPSGQLQRLDARHRTQAHVEDRVKELKACGGRRLPSTSWDRNSAWLQLAALAVSLLAWLRHVALDGALAVAEPKKLRFRLLAVPARHVRHARRRVLKLPPDWAWSPDLAQAWDRLRALRLE